MAKSKIFQNVEGLHIEAELYDREGDAVPIAAILGHKMFALRPGTTEEEEWDTTLVEPNILRHTVPDDADLGHGKYKIHPYIETVDGYKGRAEWFVVDLRKYWR